MVEHDAVQAAPAVVVLVGRAAEGGRERRTGEQVEGTGEALEDHHVAPVFGVGDPGHGEEVDAGGADAGVDAEVVQEVAERLHGLAAAGAG